MKAESDFFNDLLDKNTAARHIVQGSDEWDKIRCGRFTASEIHLLMDSGKRDMTPEELKARPKSGPGSSAKLTVDHSKFSESGYTYINLKVAETLTGRIQDSSYAFPLVYGKETELEAVQYFENTKGLETFEVGFQPFGDHAGGSPDRFVEGDAGLEVKCPFTSEKQIEYLMLTDVFDLKRNFPQIYWQVMSNMLFTDKKKWHLITYDPRFTMEKLKMTHMVILPNQEDFDLICVKLERAIKEKLEMIQRLQ
jgi:hypothetical protein